MTGWKLVPWFADEAMGRASGMREKLPGGGAITQWAANKWPDMLRVAPSPPDDLLVNMARAFLSTAAGEAMLPGGFDARCEASCINAMRAALAQAETDHG